MPTIHALFDSYAEARDAVNALEAHGIDPEEISVIASRSDPPEAEPTATAEGAELGTDLGELRAGAGPALYSPHALL